MEDDAMGKKQQRQFQPISQNGLESLFYQDRHPVNGMNLPGDHQSEISQGLDPHNDLARNMQYQVSEKQDMAITMADMPTAIVSVPVSNKSANQPEVPRNYPHTNSSTHPGLAELFSNRKKLIFATFSLFCLVVLLGVSGLVYLRHKLAPPDVTLYNVSKQNASQDIGASGLIYPRQRLDISYPYTVHVTSVLIKPGDQVKPNQSLVQLDLSQINATQLATLNAQVSQAAQDLAAAQSYLNSVLPLGNPVVTAQAQNQYDMALSKYNALTIQAGSPTLHEGNLVSPLSGTVIAVNVSPGQIFAANKIMLTIYDESSVIVRVKVPLSSYRQVHLNQPAQIMPSALPGQSYAGTVMSIILNSDSQTDTFEVWVSVLNKNFDLLPGMSVFASLHNVVQALVVPRLAVLNPDRDSTVFVVRNQHAYIQPVQVIGYSGDAILIGKGLSAGDQILLVGLDGLQNGQGVHVTAIEG